MISVLKAGLYTALQDGGRVGCRSMGVPISGCMDDDSARFANHLLQNNLDACVLEFTAIAPSLKFEIDTQIAITGAEATIKINDVVFEKDTMLPIKKGDVLAFSSLKSGWRGYIAVRNGFESEVALNSQSQYKGITEAQKIEKGQNLFIKAVNLASKFEGSQVFPPTNYSQKQIKIYKGPEFELLSKEIQEQLLNTDFTISPSSNRMAILIEEEIKGEISEIITAPVQPGTIQLTPSGKLIILMRDAQTSGGYLRVFQCSEKAINLLAQKRPKEKISFKLKC